MNKEKRDLGPVVTCCNLLPRTINTRLNILPEFTRTGNNNNKTPTSAYPWNAQTVNTNCPVTVNFKYR